MGDLNFWGGFGDTSDFIEVTCDFDGSLATRVLEEFSIPVATPGIGGALDDLDIKHMDALTVVRMSLLHHSAKNGGIYEPIVNPFGEVEFKSIGSYSANLGNYYYEIQSSVYREYCTGVLVTGKKPLPIRKEPIWKPIWGDSQLIFDTSNMLSNCMKDNFCQYSTIVFNDPHTDSAFEDGIDNLYEIGRENPYDNILGYAYYKNPPEAYITDDTVIKYTDSSAVVPLKLAENNLGELFARPVISDDNFANEEDCNLMYEAQAAGGVDVPIPEKIRYEDLRGDRIDKFNQIQGVYMIGLEIDYYQSIPRKKEYANTLPTEENSIVMISINDKDKKIFKLNLGVDYAPVIEGSLTDKTIKVAFARNASSYDNAHYGNNTEYVVIPTCAWAKHETNGKGTIFPRSVSKAILVYETWICVELDTPSIVIYDPDGTDCRARAIAENLEFDIAALVITDEPAPVGFNGREVDQISGIVDHDPTTSQALADTDLERIYDIMDGGGGLTLSLSFLNKDETIELSGVLHDYMNSGDGIETTYICAPDSNPQLGGIADNGGIINKISYQYSDQGSYTISATSGPRLVGGLSQIDGGPMFKQSEEASARGTVIQDMGNHVYYKVRIDGFGERVAINTCPDIIRVGDKVQCSISNNPVES